MSIGESFPTRSLAIRTNLIWAKRSALVKENRNYITVKTPSRPSFFWGNYVVMRQAPSKACFSEWVGIFEHEIGSRAERGFCSLMWDVPNVRGDASYFLSQGFELDGAKILVCKREDLVQPSRFNRKVNVQLFQDDRHWDEYVQIHFDKDWNYGSDQDQRSFLREEMEVFRRVCEGGQAIRMGAYLDGMGTADLGLFWEGKVGRFNSVSTHESYRRQGICGRLVYETCRFAFETLGLETLVMEADEDYHAAKIYESVGFKLSERIFSLGWFDKGKFC